MLLCVSSQRHLADAPGRTKVPFRPQRGGTLHGHYSHIHRPPTKRVSLHRWPNTVQTILTRTASLRNKKSFPVAAWLQVSQMSTKSRLDGLERPAPPVVVWL